MNARILGERITPLPVEPVIAAAVADVVVSRVTRPSGTMRPEFDVVAGDLVELVIRVNGTEAMVSPANITQDAPEGQRLRVRAAWSVEQEDVPPPPPVAVDPVPEPEPEPEPIP